MSNQITLTFPDNTSRQFPKGSTLLDVAEGIGSRLAQDAVAGKINGLIESRVEIEFSLGKLSIFIDEKNSIHMKGLVSNIKNIEIKL